MAPEGKPAASFFPLPEISKDVAHARNAAKNDPEFARLLYRNAQALMAAWQERGEEFDKASAAIMRELASLPKGRWPDKTVRDKAEDFQRGIGRTPFGEAWIPGNWLKALPPSSLAAIRRSIPPSCQNCGGLGKTDCAKCSGTGFTPCKNPKCNGGHIHVLPDNVLNPATALKVRKKCPVCKGLERLACRACRGEKAIPCKKCKGDGYAPQCRNCHGTGLKSCSKCASGFKSGCPVCKDHGEVLCAKCGGSGRLPD